MSNSHEQDESSPDGLVSKLIQRLMTHHGLTQGAISRLTDIPQPRISRWLIEGNKSADDALKLQELDHSMRPQKRKKVQQ